MRRGEEEDEEWGKEDEEGSRGVEKERRTPIK